ATPTTQLKFIGFQDTGTTDYSTRPFMRSLYRAGIDRDHVNWGSSNFSASTSLYNNTRQNLNLTWVILLPLLSVGVIAYLLYKCCKSTKPKIDYCNQRFFKPRNNNNVRNTENIEMGG